MDLVFIFSRLFKWFCISIEEVSHLNVKNKKIEKSMLRIIARKNTFDNKLTFGAIVLTIIIAISLITGLFLIQSFVANAASIYCKFNYLKNRRITKK